MAFARELVTDGDPEEEARFDANAHDRFLLYEDLSTPVGVLRSDLLAGRSEAELLEAYAALEGEGWLTGVNGGSGPGVIDLLERNADKFTGRKGIPFAEVLEKEIAALARNKKAPPAAVDVARRLFSPGTSRAPYRRNLGIELINGKGDGAYFRTVDTLLRNAGGDGWRVAIVDDAHKMTSAAENAFLKTLEEPPPRTLLILVTAEPLSLLPTTISRCARVVFDAIAPSELERFLRERQGLEEDAAPLLASLAEGSVRRGLELRDHDFAGRRTFVEEMLRAVAAGDLSAALALAGSCFGKEAKERGRAGERDEARVVLELLALSFRDLAVVSTAPAVPPVSGLDPEAARMLAARRPAADWERLFGRTEMALSDVASHVEPRLAVESLLAEGLSDSEMVV
ncbi:MAG: hypothetical protein HKN12_01765 [Gemmatimonadetes bacterium]|nr:hypothetical protein [Gemmatimonadota bacterium]